MNKPLIFILTLSIGAHTLLASSSHEARIRAVAESEGLIAFWDFSRTRGDQWVSVHDPKLEVESFPVSLRRVGDPASYTLKNWPHQDPASAILHDSSGPFGHAVRFNRGYVYGSVERKAFDQSLLDLRGRQPFTMIAWVKFVGKRHMVAGIWDEGGWDKYAGRRQIALFGGLFGQKGAIAHISATGAASYPQSTTSGAQYARLRAIDGQAFSNEQWVALAMTFTPETSEVRAYLNGKMTPLLLNDPVTDSVYRYKDRQAANPFKFPLPIYSPRAFILKYNGYRAEAGVNEHRLRVDLDGRTLRYEREPWELDPSTSYRMFFDIKRGGASLLDREIVMTGERGRKVLIPAEIHVKPGDEIFSRLESSRSKEWVQVGMVVRRDVQEGAPFTFGRALGLGAEDPGHGSQLYLDGVAVFSQVLTEQELKRLSFRE